MELKLGVLVVICICHVIGDFFLQTDWMAENKSSDETALFAHLVAYTSVFLIPALLLLLPALIFAFLAGIFVTHGITDMITSRITKKFWEEKKTHAFFCTVGIDQAIHMITLFIIFGMCL